MILEDTDLPLSHEQPSYSQIKDVLDKIPTGEHLWDLPKYEEKIILNWLIKLLATNLEWITVEEERDYLVSTICERIAERSGRLAAPTRKREFSLSNGVSVVLREPTMTYNTLGFKTWGSAPLLSANLPKWEDLSNSINALELGAGTGLVGISAAIQLGWQVVCTDLPDIVENMQYNVDYNSELIQQYAGSVSCHVLDWMNPPDDDNRPSWLIKPFQRIIASDCIYETHFGELAIALFRKYLAKDGIVITEYPLRETHLEEIGVFEKGMDAAGFERQTGEEIGEEDFGSLYPVTCRWSRWKYHG